MTEEMIKGLEQRGFRRWTKPGYDRLYVYATVLGLDYDTYRTGNICWAVFNGKEISNSQARRYLNAKIYIDLLHDDRVVCEYDALREAAEKIVNEVKEGKNGMWICRAWTKEPDGWVSEFDSFETEEEANEHGEIFMRVMKDDGLEHDYEVYNLGGKHE